MVLSFLPWHEGEMELRAQPQPHSTFFQKPPRKHFLSPALSYPFIFLIERLQGFGQFGDHLLHEYFRRDSALSLASGIAVSVETLV